MLKGRESAEKSTASGRRDGDSWKYALDSMQISIIDPDTMQEFIVANTDPEYSVYGVKIGDDRESALESISDYGLMIWTSRPSLDDCDLEIYIYGMRPAFRMLLLSNYILMKIDWKRVYICITIMAGRERPAVSIGS